MFSRPSAATTHPPAPTTRLPRSRRVRVLAALVALAAALVPLALGWQPIAPLHAEGPTDQGVVRDVYHTMLARNALLQDLILAPLNVGVRVQDRVAVLWGPVPSAEVMRRAIAVLRKMPELIDVRNQMHVEPADASRPQYLPDPEPLPLPPQPPALPPSPPPLPGLSREDGARGVLAKRPANTGDVITPAENVRLRPAPPPGFPAANGDDQGEPVLPTIAVPTIAVPQAGPAPANWSAVQLGINSLRLADPRFQGLRAEARAGQVHLSGSAASWSDVRDFAAGLNRLPGVERVILGEVRTER